MTNWLAAILRALSGCWHIEFEVFDSEDNTHVKRCRKCGLAQLVENGDEIGGWSGLQKVLVGWCEPTPEMVRIIERSKREAGK